MGTTRMVIIAAAVTALAAPLAVQAAPKNGSGGGTTTTTTTTTTIPKDTLDIATAISDTADPVTVGEEFTYRTVVSNVGTATARGLEVNVWVRHADVRGTALFSSVTTTQGSCTINAEGFGSQVPFHGASDMQIQIGWWHNEPYERYSIPKCTIGTLAPGSTATIDVVVRPTYPAMPPDPRYTGPMVAETSHSLERSDTNSGNNRDREGTTVTTGDPVLDCMLTLPKLIGPLLPCFGTDIE